MVKTSWWERASTRSAKFAVRSVYGLSFLGGVLFTLAIVGLLVVFSVVSTSETDVFGRKAMPEDPVFNLPFNPSTVQFQTVSIDSLGQCGPLLDPLGPGGGKAFVFARLVNGRQRVFILGNEDRRAAFGLSGVLLVVRGDNCRTSGPLLALRRNAVDDPSLDPGLSANDVSLLMRDMLERYANAFGSKVLFLGWLDRLTADANMIYRETPGARCPLTYTITFTSPMMEALEAYRRA
jgi:hypothetical protein